MNTPPPEGSAAANGNGLAHGNGSSSSSGYLGLHHDDDIRLHSPALRKSPPLDERKHECPEGDEPPLALMLRTVDFAAYVSVQRWSAADDA